MKSCLITCILMSVVLLSCKPKSPTVNASGEVPSDDVKQSSIPNPKVGAVVTVESYYQKNRQKYLVLAEAKTADEFKKAFDSVLHLHARKDIPNFKLSCPYFYQFHEITKGIANQFQDLSQAWVKLMAQDLQQIIKNLLSLPSDDTVDFVIKIFACRFNKEHVEEFIPLDAARGILGDVERSIQDALD